MRICSVTPYAGGNLSLKTRQVSTCNGAPVKNQQQVHFGWFADAQTAAAVKKSTDKYGIEDFGKPADDCFEAAKTDPNIRFFIKRGGIFSLFRVIGIRAEYSTSTLSGGIPKETLDAIKTDEDVYRLCSALACIHREAEEPIEPDYSDNPWFIAAKLGN